MDKNSPVINNRKIKENKLGVMPINKLVVNMSIPLIISMLIQALYNFVDSFFVAHIEENAQEAITALSLALSFQMVVIAITVGTGVGINAVLSRWLGKKNYEKVNMVAGNSLILAAITSVVFLILGLTTVRGFFEIQTDNPIVIQYGIDYLSVIITFGGAKVFQIFLERMLQATGRASLSMYSQGISAILNIFLDPLFIFVFGMGVKGAAIATIIAQFIGAGIAVFFNIKYNKDIKLSKKYIRFDLVIVKEIYEIGLPAIIMQIFQSIMIFGLNMILYTISEVSVTAYGIYFKVQQLLFMPVYGISNAIIPIIGYNYGAKKPERIKHGIIGAIKFGMLIMAFGMILFEIFPKEIFGLFNPSDRLSKVGIACIRIITLSYLFVDVNVILQSSLQALGEGKKALGLAILRTVGILLPVAFLLSKLPNPDMNIWWAFVISESITMIVGIKEVVKVYKNKIKKI